MNDEIIFRTVMEVIGKPKEHVEATLKEYVTNLKKSGKYKVLVEEYAEPQKQEKDEMWSTFVELEIKTQNMQDLTEFCFNYMPSIIEVLEPLEFKFSDVEMSEFLTTLQGRLHEVDILAKHLQMETDFFQKNMAVLFHNYLQVLLGMHKRLTSEQMSKLTGVDKDRLEDYLDHLIDEGKVDMKEGVYFLIEEKETKKSNASLQEAEVLLKNPKLKK